MMILSKNLSTLAGLALLVPLIVVPAGASLAAEHVTPLPSSSPTSTATPSAPTTEPAGEVVTEPTEATAPARTTPATPSTEPGADIIAIEKKLHEPGTPTAEESKEIAEVLFEGTGGKNPAGASLGQGLSRLAENGDAQAPTKEELLSAVDLIDPDTDSESLPARSAAAVQSNASRWLPPYGTHGMDVSSHQPSIDWTYQRALGSQFAYVKASEGDYYSSPLFNQQYSGAGSVGMLRGAYHFAIPSQTSGAAQARYFVARGGGWTADGNTLPPLLDIEYNPYTAQVLPSGRGNTCYGMSASQMVSWIRDFSNTMVTLTGRVPMIYSTTDWWSVCTGNSAAFGDHPLHIASYNNSGPGTLPASWRNFTVWQHSDSGPFAGDSNVFNGSFEQLRTFARNGAPAVRMSAIEATWRSMGGDNSSFGRAVSKETCGTTACSQDFANGRFHWTASSGANGVLYRGINARWQQLGAQNGRLGYPTTNETCGTTVCAQSFQGGRIVYSPAGTRAVYNSGIGAKWRQQGNEAGRLSYPIDEENCTGNTCKQTFANGTIHWTAASGPWPVYKNAITAAWARNGAQNGRYGFPTSDESCGTTACWQEFQGGQFSWTAARGIIPVHPSGISATWRHHGGQTGIFGHPTVPESCTAIQCWQAFSNGQITWDAGKGYTLLTYRN